MIHDACATRDRRLGEVVIPAPQVHGAFMAALKMRFARVMALEEYLRTFPLVPSP